MRAGLSENSCVKGRMQFSEPGEAVRPDGQLWGTFHLFLLHPVLGDLPGSSVEKQGGWKPTL